MSTTAIEALKKAADLIGKLERENAMLAEALRAVLAEEMIYTGAITETLRASEMYPELLAKIDAALAGSGK